MAHDDDGVVQYEPSEPVTRIEYRCHQTVIEQIARGLGRDLKCYAAGAEFLNELWCYGLSVFRLDWSRTYVDPLWQWLYQDVRITDLPKREMVKRVYKGPGSCEQRNICLAVGNALSVYAREGLTTVAVIERLRGAGLWKKFVRYAKERDRDPQALIGDGLLRRRLVGVAA